MEPEATKVLFFGDHASDKVAIIRSLVRASKQSPAVRRFVGEATDILQLEFSSISRFDHGWNKPFDSLLELAEANASLEEAEGGQNGVLTCVLMGIGRLGKLVLQAEQDASILGSTDPTSSPVEVIGLCMGELPAVVALVARDSTHIFTLAREVLKVIFRLAFRIWNRMRLIDASPGSWAHTFVSLPVAHVQDTLDRFHDECNIPIVCRIAIGVVSTGFVTLFGPPSTHARLQTWPGAGALQNAPQIKTEAGGCVHTPYLPQVDVDAVLADCSDEFLQWPLDHKHKSRMLSPVDGKFYEHQTLGDLLREVIKDITQRVLDLDRTFETCASRLKEDGHTDINLVIMGQNAHIPTITGTLKAAGINYKVTQGILPSSIPVGISDKTSISQSTRDISGQIAIVGMSGRFPENDTIQGFWEDLLDGKTHIKDVPADRFNVEDWYDPTLEKKNSTVATKGAWLANPGLFDQKLFNISPREASQIDPIHRHLLTCSYEALQHAGYNPGASLSMEGHNVSTFFGQLGEDWHDIIHQKGADIYYVPGIARTFAPSRVNYHYKFGGGSYAIDSACASSITTIVLACQALQSRACDMALAGGGNMIYTPVPYSGLSRSGMISPTDGCRTFHDDADGYCRGEGVGVVVLKRLEDAQADNDNILGVIRGSARTFSTTTTSITHPSHESQERVYKRVLAQSSIEPSEIAYVEMHGTGTQAGDWEEMTSVLNVMAPQGSRTKDNPLTVGTVKAAVGHGEAAAGVTALIKTLLMLRDKVIPPQPGWPFKINQRFPPLDPHHIRIATQVSALKPSPKGDKTIKIMVNSFDASGGESCLLIEEAPSNNGIGKEPTKDPRSAHVVTLSGKTTNSLAENRQRLLEWLDRHPDANLADIAYTTTSRRMHEPLRAAYAATSIADLAQQLEDAISKGEDPKMKPKGSGRIFLFTGQGSHYAGMSSLLFNTNRSFREKISCLQDIATHMGLPEFLFLVSNPDFEGNATTTQTQLAIVALEICMAELLAMYGLVPTAVLGHSLGEYAALCVAGVLSVADTLYLVGHRALLMEDHLTPNRYAMLATSATPEKLETAYTSLRLASCSIACKNSPTITVASGTVEDIEKLQTFMKNEGARCTILRIPYGFHSAQVEPILGEFTQLANGVDFKAPSLPFVSSFLGRIVDIGDQSVFGSRYLAEQCRGTVDFVGALHAIADAEETAISQVHWIEVGPDSTLTGLTQKTLSACPSKNFFPAFKPNPSEDNWMLLSKLLKGVYESGVDVNWSEFHREFRSCTKLLELPLYAFNYRNFWHEPFQDPETLLLQSGRLAPVADAAVSMDTVMRPPVPGFPSSSLQMVDSEEISESRNTIRAVFSSDTADLAIMPVIDGHVVLGRVICPMSVLVDMALTAASYCHFRLYNITKSAVISVTDINMIHALALQANEPRRPMIRVTATMEKPTKSVEILFTWVKFAAGDASPLEETGGTCVVNFEEEEKLAPSVNNSLFLIKSRIASLRSAALTGQAHCLLKPVIYRMFSETVNYSKPFQGIEQAILGMDCQDAIAKVTLPSDIPAGKFAMNPFWTDALTHLGGFLLNSGLRYDEDDLLCMARGFDSWRVMPGGTDMVPGQTYTCYTFMQDVDSGSIVGDCYIFDGNDNLVQTLLGLKFLKLRKAVFNNLFGTTASSDSIATVRPKVIEKPQAGSVAKFPYTASSHLAPTMQSVPSTIASRISDLSSVTPPLSNCGNTSDDGNILLNSILSVIAREAGCLPNDLVDETMFADLGVDSLMGISILAMIKRETGVDLDPTFFMDYDTIREARLALESILGVEKSTSFGTPTSSDMPATPVNGLKTPVDAPLLLTPNLFDFHTSSREPTDTKPMLTAPVKQLTSLHLPKANSTSSITELEVKGICETMVPSPGNGYAARVIHLSGPKAAPTTQVFLLADESGSSLACIQLPAISHADGRRITIWGVESPFTKNPHLLLEHSVSELARISVDAIREHQNKRPGRFLLGGLSAGAAVAIEAARQFTTSKDFAGLILLNPSLTVAEVNAVATAPNTQLKPTHKAHVTNMTAIMKDYVNRASALPPVGGMATAIVLETPTLDYSKALRQLVPNIQLVTSVATQNGMSFPAADSTGQAYQEAIRNMVEKSS